MKILLVSIDADGSRKVSGGADSALLRQGEPVFVSEPVEAWELLVAPAVRVSRLGFHIPLKHAGRYYDAIAAVALQLPVADDGVPPLFHDRAVSPGEWLDAARFAGSTFILAVTRTPLPGRDSEIIFTDVELSLDVLAVDETVAWLSRNMTLKTGDIIIFGQAARSLGSPLPDTALTATIGGIGSLSVRIK